MSDFKRLHRGFVILRGKAGDNRFADAVANVLGTTLPSRPNTFSAAGNNEIRTYWLGPDEWLISANCESATSLVGKLEEALAGQSVAINDISGGLVLLELSGEDGRELLARGCTLDLYPEKFSVGDCAQSTLAKANVLIACIDGAPVYEIIVRRSFSEYLLRWLRQTHLSLAGSASYS